MPIDNKLPGNTAWLPYETIFVEEARETLVGGHPQMPALSRASQQILDSLFC